MAEARDGRLRYGKRNRLNDEIKWYWIGILDGIRFLHFLFRYCQYGLEWKKEKIKNKKKIANQFS